MRPTYAMFRLPVRLQFPALLLLLAVSAGIALTEGPASSRPGAPAAGAPPLDLPGVPHVARLSDRLYTGGLPEGDTGFRTLRSLGVRSIISVDGAPPDLEAARRHGLRYVHLPIRYDGCPAPQADLIVRAVRELPGAVYLHCHHGRHRAPAAAALARRALDGLSVRQAHAEMRRAGTDPRYSGLWSMVTEYKGPTPAAARPGGGLDLPEVTPPPPLVASMVDLERQLTRLGKISRRGWTPSDAAAAGAAAILMREEYRELLRLKPGSAADPGMSGELAAAEREARMLQQAIETAKSSAADEALARVEARCSSCHSRFRDGGRGG